jgi:hypothetical protein
MAGSRISHYYMPPITKVQKLNKDQLVNATIFETVADVASFEPTARIFYEMDCRQK